MTLRPSRAHLSLGERFFDAVSAASFPMPRLRFRNQRWAERVGLGSLDDEGWERHFARFEPIEGSLPAPLALRYHGHQFGVYNPGLGDGRGFLFAQLYDDDSRLLDLGTKGSGKTPWSRGGDGRLTLQGGVREVLATEMLEALGVSTSKSFSLFETCDSLSRGDEPSPTRAAVLVRLSHSHLRFGTFQRLEYEGDTDGLTRLVDHVVEHYAPEIADAADRPLALLTWITERTARLAAAIDVAGFVHGVLNTDNMSVTGECFDYGPYRFIGRADPKLTAAYFDEVGLYAYGRQPETFRWNLMRLADALRLIAPSSPLGGVVGGFVARFDEERAKMFLRRLGLGSRGADSDRELTRRGLAFLGESEVTLSRFYFDWFGGVMSAPRALAGPARAEYQGEAFSHFRRSLEGYEPRCASATLAPYFRGDAPVSLTHDIVVRLWRRISEHDDWEPFHRHIEAIRDLGAQCSGCAARPGEGSAPGAPGKN